MYEYVSLHTSTYSYIIHKSTSNFCVWRQQQYTVTVVSLVKRGSRGLSPISMLRVLVCPNKRPFKVTASFDSDVDDLAQIVAYESEDSLLTR